VVHDPPDAGAVPAAAVSAGGTAEVAGIALTSADKVLYPGEDITKLDLARYYAAVEEQALRHLAHRPVTLVRCPEGQAGGCFYQKHMGSGLPEAIRTVDVAEKDGGTEAYLVVEDLAGLVALVQMGVLEIHPWGATVDDIERPDQLIFDLDPDVGLGWERIVEAAFDLKRLFDELGLAAFPKTTGGKGLHIVLPIKPELEWEEAKSFCKAIADAFAAAQPERYTAVMAKRARRGRLFIDYLRNGRGSTAVGAFSTRARPGAPVSAPLSWAEVEDGVRSDAFTVRTMPERLAAMRRDPWRDFFSARQSTRPVLKKLGL